MLRLDVFPKTVLGFGVLAFAPLAGAQFTSADGRFDLNLQSIVNVSPGQVDDMARVDIPVRASDGESFFLDQSFEADARFGGSSASLLADVTIDVSDTRSFFEATISGAAFAEQQRSAEGFADLFFGQNIGVDEDTLVEVRMLVEVLTTLGDVTDPIVDAETSLSSSQGVVRIRNTDDRMFFQETTTQVAVSSGGGFSLNARLGAGIDAHSAPEIQSVRVLFEATIIPAPASASLIGGLGLVALRRRR